MTTSAVEKEIQKANGLKPLDDESRNDYLKRLIDGVQGLDSDSWEELSTDAQNWSNEATDAVKADEQSPNIKDFANGKADDMDIPEELRRDTPEKNARAEKAWSEHSERQRAKEVAKPKASKPDAKKASAKKTSKKRDGSKKDIIVELLLRLKGATAKELMDAAGWTKITVPGQARSAELDLVTEKDGSVTRYFGSPMKGKTPTIDGKVSASGVHAAARGGDKKPVAKKAAAKVAPKKAATKKTAKPAPKKAAKRKSKDD